MKKTITAVLVCLLVSLMAAPAWSQPALPGQGNIKIGPLEIHPSIGLTQTYTDNVYQSYDGRAKENDWITTISPGLELVLPLRRHSLRLGYFADINRYMDFNENNYVRQVARGSMNFDFPGGLLLSISDTFINSEVPRKWREQPGLAASSDPYRSLPYTSNDLSGQARYRFADRWAAALQLSNYRYDYDKQYDRSGSFDRNLAGGSLFYRFTARTDALVEYQHSWVNYPNNKPNDNQNSTVYVGLGFDPTAKLAGQLKAGWTQKKYETQAARAKNTIDAFATQIDLTYSLSRYDVIRLRGVRAIEEDSDTNQPFTRDDYSLGYSHIFSMNEKIRLNALIGFGKSKYEAAGIDVDGATKTRDDNILYTTIGVDYAMQRWLLFSLNYTYQNKDSNFLRYDYTENRVFFNATVSF